MAQVKLDLNDTNEADTVALGKTVHSAMLANAATFTAPNPPLATMLTNLNAADAAIADSDMADQDAKLKTGLKNAAVALVRSDLTTQGATVQSVSGGQANIILLAGLAVRDTASPSNMTQVLNLSVTNGDAEGSLDAHWDGQKRVKSYEVQTSPDPITASSWVFRLVAPGSTANIPNLTIGAKTWVRVRAVGHNNTGPWSDPAVKMVS